MILWATEVIIDDCPDAWEIGSGLDAMVFNRSVSSAVSGSNLTAISTARQNSSSSPGGSAAVTDWLSVKREASSCSRGSVNGWYQQLGYGWGVGVSLGHFWRLGL